MPGKYQLIIKYNGEAIYTSVPLRMGLIKTIKYKNKIIYNFSVGESGTKTILCKNKCMKDNIIIGDTTILFKDKIMKDNLIITAIPEITSESQYSVLFNSEEPNLDSINAEAICDINDDDSMSLYLSPEQINQCIECREQINDGRLEAMFGPGIICVFNSFIKYNDLPASYIVDVLENYQPFLGEVFILIYLDDYFEELYYNRIDDGRYDIEIEEDGILIIAVRLEE